MKLPVIVLTGDKDPIGTAGVGQRAFARLMRRIPAEAKERHRFADGYHDLIHDSNEPRALRCIADWLDRQLQKSGAATKAARLPSIREHQLPGPVKSGRVPVDQM